MQDSASGPVDGPECDPRKSGMHAQQEAEASGSSPASDAGMAERVTRHALITGPSEWRFLDCGVDTLDLGVFVDWSNERELMRCLDHEKEKARRQGGSIWRDTKLGPVLVLPAGSANGYRFRLRIPDYLLSIAGGRRDDETPNVYASISAHRLWTSGVQEAVEVLEACLTELGGTVDRVKVSRCDLAADFIIPGGLTLPFLEAHRVGRSRKTFQALDAGRLETYYVGEKRSPVQARIYDKTRQIAGKPELQWYWDLWQLTEGPEVWRIEFQLRRATLRAFGVESIKDLRVKGPGLWRYLTSRWLSIRLHDSSNTTRREPHPWWDAVQQCAETLGQVMDVPRVDTDSSAIPSQWYVSHVGGCLASFAAREGVEKPEAAIELLGAKVLEYWAGQDWASEYAKRRIQLNQDAESAGDCDAPF